MPKSWLINSAECDGGTIKGMGLCFTGVVKMLQQLEICNIALIDRVSIELGRGLNILTGETGAGKSIIIDSINAILGNRLSRELIRTGREKASVQAVFITENEQVDEFLTALGIECEEDGTLVVSREFSMSGKNICRINGTIVTVSILKDLGELLIDVHGQHDNQSLLRVEAHIELLDSFAGEELYLLKKEYRKLLEAQKTLKVKLKSFSGDRKDRERKIDLLKYQIDEIKKAKLKQGEEDELNRQRIILSNSEKILSALARAYGCITSDDDTVVSALDITGAALAELNTVARIDEKYLELSKRLEDLAYQLEDIAEDIRKERDVVEYNPDLLEAIEERLDLIYRLKKKYGNSIGEILSYGADMEKELEEIYKSEEIVEEILKQLEHLNDEMYKLTKKIHLLRKNAAVVLESRISRELEELEMKRAQFKVDIKFDDIKDENGERKFTSGGLDKVEFLISPNAGEPLKPLAKIASGGEMSRIMLAIKTILADIDQAPTLIFDEIDTGISGRAAQKVGEKLAFISTGHQVICITHLAQIACMADHHYLIEKITEEGTTFTNVNKMAEKEIKNEIARILGGTNISGITLKHAEEMIKLARKFKKEGITA